MTVGRRILKSLGIAAGVTLLSAVAIPLLCVAAVYLYGQLVLARQKAGGFAGVGVGIQQFALLLLLIFVIAFAISHRRLGRKRGSERV